MYGNNPAPFSPPPPVRNARPLMPTAVAVPTPTPGRIALPNVAQSTVYASLPQTTLHVGDTFVVNVSANVPWENHLHLYHMMMSFNSSAFTAISFSLPAGAINNDVAHGLYVVVGMLGGLSTKEQAGLVGGYQPLGAITFVVNPAGAGANWAFALQSAQLCAPSGNILCGINAYPCAPGQLTDFRGGWNGVGYVNVV